MSNILNIKEEISYTYIYTLADPKSNEIRYVGKTNNINLRLKEHIRKAKCSHTHKNHWILSLIRKNLIPIIEIIDIVNKNECGFWEQYWMDTFRQWGFNLTNIALGGIGGNLGKTVNDKISKKLKNRKFSNETINKMKFAAKNRKLTEEGRKSLSKHRMGSGNPMFGKHRPENSKKYRKVIQMDLNSNYIKTWKGIIIASKNLNINRCTISDVCNKRKKTAGGFKWKYV